MVRQSENRPCQVPLRGKMLACEVGKMQKYVDDIVRQTDRVLWEAKNIIRCIPDTLWDKLYSGAPVYRHVYHMLHSLDRWFINPYDAGYTEPAFHVSGLNDLDAVLDACISRAQIDGYLEGIEKKIKAYTRALTDELLSERPENCPFTRLALILGQYRHLYAHVGMLMGWIIAFDGRWPLTLGMEREIPEDGGIPFFA